MGSDLPVRDVPLTGLVERRQAVRRPVRRPIIGHVLPVERSVILRDISPAGFSVLAATMNLTLGAAYEFRFEVDLEAVVVRARLAHAMRIRGDRTVGYLAGFEFIDAQRDEAAIAVLLAQARMDAI